MKLAIYSDLHLEFNAWVPPPIEADVVVLAGDIDVLAERNDVPAWAKRHWPKSEVVQILGNHEYYRTWLGMAAELERARGKALDAGVHLLENDCVVISGVRFLGCTLWTDFQLRGSSQASMEAAARAMNDFRVIRVDNGEGGTEPFAPQDSVQIHRRSVAWLDAELTNPFDGKSVVITHHSPHPKCEHAFYATSSLSPAFCSDLGWLIERHQPELWISGHTHASHDVRIGATRLVSNQRGYRDTPEHADAPFNPSLVIEI